MSRPTMIAGNWKMNHGPAATRAFFEHLEVPRCTGGLEVVLFPPAVSLESATSVVASTRPAARVRIGVQDVHWEEKGAFTGETSAAMAAETGATYALIGHSERRHLFGETDEEVALKTIAVCRAGLIPTICVGETLEERRSGRLAEVILAQLDAVLPVLSDQGDGSPRFVLAYEPVWAIGTGETASSEDASEAHGLLRDRLNERLGSEIAFATTILYGGSVNPDNASVLLHAQGVDGVLVGGASLDPNSFAKIIEAGC